MRLKKSSLFLSTLIFHNISVINAHADAPLKNTPAEKSEAKNKTCLDPEMVFIPAGEFIMGSDEKEKGSSPFLTTLP
ncbi:MAG: hypothetical protein QGG87_06285 [Nitrospinota bacterium]|nr:hypothetical protein [Nitrospinota bacterium]